MKNMMQFKQEDMVSWGAKLKVIRVTLGESIDSMAEKLETEGFLLNMAERGKLYAPYLIQKILEPEWGVNQEWFFNGELPMFIANDTPEEFREHWQSTSILDDAAFAALEKIESTSETTEEEASFIDCVESVFGKGSPIGVEIINRGLAAIGTQQASYFEHGMRHGAQLIIDMLCNEVKAPPKGYRLNLQSLIRDCIFAERAG